MGETESTKDVLIRISQFIIRKESEDFGKNCQDALVKTVLLISGNAGLSFPEIMKEIEQQMGIKNFPVSTIKSVVERLSVQKVEIYEKEGKYFLEGDVYEKMKETSTERRKVLASFESSIKAKMQTKLKKTSLDATDIDLVFEALYEFLVKWLHSESSFVANLLFYKKKVTAPDFPTKILDEIVEKVQDSNLRQAIKNSILETFWESEKVSTGFLYEVLQSYLHLELLNIDPECRCLQRVAFSNKTLVLDTNILMALFLKRDLMHEGTIETLSLARDLGINLVFTKRTKQEWLWGLERASEEFRSIQDAKPSLLETLGNVFILSYLKENEINSSLTWQGFYLQMRQLEKFTSERGIKYWYKKEFELDKLPNKEFFDPLDGRVYSCAKLRGNIKSKDVCEHDAYHLLLVRKLREEHPTDILGPSHWFLTYDTSLICADEGLNEFIKAPFDPPSSMLANMWITMIAPFLGPEVPENRLADAFAHLMKTHFAIMPSGLSADQIIEVLGQWLPYKTLSGKDIEAILGDALVTKYYDELREARIWNPSKVRELREKLRKQVDDKVYEIFDEKVTSAERRRAEAEKRALQREQELIAEKTQRRLIFKLCAILGTIYALFGLALIGTGNLTAGVALAASSIVFIVIALAFRHIKIKAGPLEIEAKR